VNKFDQHTIQEITTMRATGIKVLTDITTEATSSIGPTQKLAKQTSDKLLAIWDETKQMKPRQFETTWLVVGLENIKTYLKGMIARTKSTITMAIPNHLDIPIDAIKGTPTSRRVHIISEVDPEQSDAEKELVQDLYTKPNVRVRKHTKLGYIAAARDGEEVLLAPFQDIHDLAGLASEQEGYIKLYQEIIGTQFLADSREIRRAEVDM